MPWMGPSINRTLIVSVGIPCCSSAMGSASDRLRSVSDNTMTVSSSSGLPSRGTSASKGSSSSEFLAWHVAGAGEFNPSWDSRVPNWPLGTREGLAFASESSPSLTLYSTRVAFPFLGVSSQGWFLLPCTWSVETPSGSLVENRAVLSFTVGLTIPTPFTLAVGPFASFCVSEEGIPSAHLPEGPPEHLPAGFSPSVVYINGGWECETRHSLCSSLELGSSRRSLAKNPSRLNSSDDGD